MKISPRPSIKGHLKLPGDKSISHRAAMIASLAEGTSRLKNFSSGADCASTLACMEQLGARITRTNNEVTLQGSLTLQQPNSPLDCGNSGSTMRILAGVLASHDVVCEMIGDESLTSRPMGRIIEPLQFMGARIDSKNGRPPLTVHGTSELKPVSYKLPVASAQVKSAVLFAALQTHGRTSVIEKTPSRDHTERMFRGFGANVDVQQDESNNTVISVDGPVQFKPGDMTIPGDVSSAAFFIAAAALLPGSELTIEHVGLNPTRTGFIDVLRSCGANITFRDVAAERGEPVGTVVVRGGLASSSGPSKVGGSIIPSVIDELPLLAVVGSQLKGGLEITGAGELRHKETDRLKATAHNLRLMGVTVEEFEDGLQIDGPTRLRGARIESFGDHRIAMAFSIGALVADGPSEIIAADCVRISFPEFYKLLDQISTN